MLNARQTHVITISLRDGAGIWILRRHVPSSENCFTSVRGICTAFLPHTVQCQQIQLLMTCVMYTSLYLQSVTLKSSLMDQRFTEVYCNYGPFNNQLFANFYWPEELHFHWTQAICTIRNDFVEWCKLKDLQWLIKRTCVSSYLKPRTSRHG